MSEHVVGRLERDGFHLGEEVETTVDRARVSFPFTRGRSLEGRAASAHHV